MALKTFTIKALGQGQLLAAAAALYTVPAATRAIISTITLVNTNAAQRTVNLYLNTAAANRRIIPVDLPLETEESLIFDDELTMEPGDMIQGDASVAADVDYTISGVEETG